MLDFVYLEFVSCLITCCGFCVVLIVVGVCALLVGVLCCWVLVLAYVLLIGCLHCDSTCFCLPFVACCLVVSFDAGFWF